jgi:hypothetical protein
MYLDLSVGRHVRRRCWLRVVCDESTFSRFLTKAPSCVTRALEEDICPPFTAHDIRDYPVYYDALYYPRYHESRFATAHSFCSWLLESLVSHHRSCSGCTELFTGCVSFDGIRIIVASQHGSQSFSLPFFESAGYHHCSVFSVLRRSVTLEGYSARSLAQHPPWLFSSKDTICAQLECVSASVLSRTVSSLLCVCVGRARKTNFIRAVCAHVVELRDTLLAMTVSEIEHEFSSLGLPIGCDRHLLLLLCAYFEQQYGSEVAAALRRPATPTYVCDSLCDSNMPWTTTPRTFSCGVCAKPDLRYCPRVLVSRLCFQDRY